MSSYSYTAVDAHGSESRGTLDVPDQIEALRRIKEMGLYPTKVFEPDRKVGLTLIGLREGSPTAPRSGLIVARSGRRQRKVRASRLTVFTRQLATLLDAGMPLLRGLRILVEQEENPRFRKVIRDLCLSIETGSSLAEAVAEHPKVFNRLYLNMVRAGEISGALEITLTRLAEFMEKSQKIKGKVKAAMVYPCAVMFVAMGILVLMMVFIVPRFRQVFEDLMGGAALPAFTWFIFKLSETFRHHLPLVALALGTVGFLGWLGLRTRWGRLFADQLKLSFPIVGPLFRKAAISRFARTLGTLLSNGVPILQALTIVTETSGNAVVARVISRLHDNVKQGDALAPTLKSASVFPVMVAGMVDVGEQTGALPEMLLKVADTYDDQVDNAAGALTSLLEPVMILFLAVIVGSIVIAMYLPILYIIGGGIPGAGAGAAGE